MFKQLALALVTSAILSTAAFAQASGTAAEAKAMLDKAVAAVKAEKAKALADFNSGSGGFKDRDLYPFCFHIADGVTVAAPRSVMGKDVRTLKDPTGKPFGQSLYDAAKDGVVTEVAYKFPRPGTSAPVDKISFVTKIGDLGCGVGYYK